MTQRDTSVQGNANQKWKTKYQYMQQTNESYKYYAEQKNPDTKEYTLFDLMYLKTKNRKRIYSDRKQNNGCLRPGPRVSIDEE